MQSGFFLIFLIYFGFTKNHKSTFYFQQKNNFVCIYELAVLYKLTLIQLFDDFSADPI